MSNSLLSGFHHTALKAVDFDQTVRFYQALGFTEALAWGEAPQRAIMLDAGDSVHVEIFEGGDPDAPAEARMIHFALRTSDCDALHAQALAAGATERMAPKDVDIPGRNGPCPVRISFVIAPGGEVVEFFQSEGV